MTLVELRPCGDQEHEWHAGRPVHEVIEELDQRVVRPVEVLDHEHHRTLRGNRLEEALPR